MSKEAYIYNESDLCRGVALGEPKEAYTMPKEAYIHAKRGL